LEGRPRERGSTGYEDKKLAEAFYHKKRAEAKEAKDFKKPSKISVRELLDWTNRNHWHYDKWESEVRALLDHFSSTRAAFVSVQDILDFRQKRMEAGIAKATINRDLALLKAAFNYAMAASLLHENPVRKVGFFNCQDNKRDKYLRPEEKIKLIESSQGILRDIIIFALKTGMRQGEILGLKWADVDLVRKQIKVICRKGGEVRTRYVPILRQAEEILMNQPRSGEHVFTKGGRPLGKWSCVHTPFHRLVVKTGVQGGDFRFHDLRHTFASDYLMMGGSRDALQDILGHVKADTTRRYAHLSKEYIKSEIEMMPYEVYRPKFDVMVA
jgi:integrase